MTPDADLYLDAPEFKNRFVTVYLDTSVTSMLGISAARGPRGAGPFVC
jgi:hypothetical protein